MAFQDLLRERGTALDTAPVRPSPARANHAPTTTHHESASPIRDARSAAEPHPPQPPASLPSEPAAEPDPEEPPRFSSRAYTGAMLYLDRGNKTVQVGFDDMPDHEIRVALRSGGFRWMPGIQRWQAPLGDEQRRVAEATLIEHANMVEARLARRGGQARSRASHVPVEPADTGTEPEAHEDAADAQGDVDSAELEDAEDDDETPGNSYERKQTARVRRLNARADAIQATANAVHASAKAKSDRIPFGQPILVGHHSEGRDRRFRGRIDSEYRKSFELQAKADELRRRAQRAEKNDAISSDDPEAITKIEAKVREVEARIDRARDINEVIRSVRASHKHGWEPIAQRRLLALGIPQHEAERLTQKDFAGRIGVPGYVAKNAAGEIARLNHRIEEFKRRDARPVSAPVRIGDAVVTEDREANRVQIRFDGIPTKEMRSSLRARGFVWAPSVGVWQRKLNDNASWAAKQVLRDYYGPNATQAPATSSQPEAMRQPGDDIEDDAPSSTDQAQLASNNTIPF